MVLEPDRASSYNVMDVTYCWDARYSDNSARSRHFCQRGPSTDGSLVSLPRVTVFQEFCVSGFG
jgi:hypothetical protein